MMCNPVHGNAVLSAGEFIEKGRTMAILFGLPEGWVTQKGRCVECRQAGSGEKQTPSPTFVAMPHAARIMPDSIKAQSPHAKIALWRLELILCPFPERSGGIHGGAGV